MLNDIRGRLTAQQGVTLVELLWYIILSLVVVVAPLYFIVTSIRQQNTVSSRTSAARQAESGLEQMVRDLRQAMSQDASGNPLSITVSNPTSGTGTGAAVSEITGIRSASFAPTSSSDSSMTLPATNPAYLSLALQVQAISQLDTTQTHTASGINNLIQVQTGVDLRNFA